MTVGTTGKLLEKKTTCFHHVNVGSDVKGTRMDKARSELETAVEPEPPGCAVPR